MKTLHLDLKPVGDNYAELRYFFDNPNQYQRRSLPLLEIADLIQLAEQDYYVRLAVDYAITGRKLYDWLDGSDRFLSRAMQQHPGESFVLAIDQRESLLICLGKYCTMAIAFSWRECLRLFQCDGYHRIPIN